jgi:hypothetical protein
MSPHHSAKFHRKFLTNSNRGISTMTQRRPSRPSHGPRHGSAVRSYGTMSADRRSAPVRQRAPPPSKKLEIHQPVKARSWPWFEPFSVRTSSQSSNVLPPRSPRAPLPHGMKRSHAHNDRFEAFLKMAQAKARIWPWSSHVCQIHSRAVPHKHGAQCRGCTRMAATAVQAQPLPERPRRSCLGTKNPVHARLWP